MKTKRKKLTGKKKPASRLLQEYYEVILEGEFSASHFLREYLHGRDEPLHGHNFKAQIQIRAPGLDRRGIAVDFVTIRNRLLEELRLLDHAHINDLPYFKKINPTSEHLAKYLYDRLHQDIRLTGGRLFRVTIWETQHCAASYVKE